MNEKSCLALSHCVRLLSAADARAVGWGLAYLLSALHFFCMVLSSAESSEALRSLWDIMGFVYMKECTSSEEQSIFFLIKRN